MSSKVPGMPAQDYALAESLGFELTEIAECWLSHIEWCKTNDVQFVGGKPWRALMSKRAERRDDEERAARVRETLSLEAQKAKDLADAAYDREAISMSDYLDSLTALQRPLTEPEERLLEAGTPPPGTDLGAWIFDAVAGPPGAKTGRVQQCACGRPVHSWVNLQRRYFASKCGGCLAIDRRNAERKAREVRQ